MKTTNYEISKKIKEIGFEARTNFYFDTRTYKAIPDEVFYKSAFDKEEFEHCLPSYDLETLLDALPSKITTKFKGDEIEETFRIYKGEIRYSVSADEVEYYIENYDYYMKFGFCVKDWEGETYADAAGRLLIKLHEAGIVNFKK